MRQSEVRCSVDATAHFCVAVRESFAEMRRAESRGAMPILQQGVAASGRGTRLNTHKLSYSLPRSCLITSPILILSTFFFFSHNPITSPSENIKPEIQPHRLKIGLAKLCYCLVNRFSSIPFGERSVSTSYFHLLLRMVARFPRSFVYLRSDSVLSLTLVHFISRSVYFTRSVEIFNFLEYTMPCL